MRWSLDKNERWAQVIRFSLKCVLVLNLLMFSLFSVWFTALFLWRFHQYLWRTWLGHPW